MINKERINIYDSYKGDADGLYTVGNEYQRNLFSAEEWTCIHNFLHDIELINKCLVAKPFTTETIARLKQNCDQESFDFFTSKIIVYRYFQEITVILRQVKSYTTVTADTVWAGFNNAEEFLEELDNDIANIEMCDYAALEKVNIEFAATGTYQELSISNGWADEYIHLSSNFDTAYEKLIKLSLK